MSGQSIPEAPVYHPTLEEWADPVTYIGTIRHTAQRHGICRIVPPKVCDARFLEQLSSRLNQEWKPHFSIKGDTKFRPRIQILSELDVSDSLFLPLCFRLMIMTTVISFCTTGLCEAQVQLHVVAD